MLIAACDTFRAGAVEQLRTHQRRLNSLHPPEKHGGQPVVQLYEKGYGKDAAGIAMEAIAYGRWSRYQLTGISFFPAVRVDHLFSNVTCGSLPFVEGNPR